MEKEIFEKLKKQPVKIVLKPRGFVLTGIIDAVFDDCIEFRTKQKTSFIDFGHISSIELSDRVF